MQGSPGVPPHPSEHARRLRLPGRGRADGGTLKPGAGPSSPRDCGPVHARACSSKPDENRVAIPPQTEQLWEPRLCRELSYSGFQIYVGRALAGTSVNRPEGTKQPRSPNRKAATQLV
ncbi:hypothetical protein PAL_GLEAN10008081 [Pteropus alecto]|uniref:Uncharacterized protein n=1 Tax=Pteropus alecto TaxID=9402 RepID=L5K141_PTEAL|nr:hypothetical protein PAL_GLEAN10008081 [Pteropus alecto]